MRTKKVFLNSLTSVVGQAIVIFVSFVARYYFIQELGRTYLGINGLFTQILAMLSLVELGVGPAIIYSLYKPLAEKNYKDVAVIMKLYKKIYTIIGIVIVALGTLMAPFVHFFIKDDLRDINLSVIFILFVLNTAISYFYSYKQNLIIADQDKYIANINHYLFYFFLNIVQLILIVNTHNYYLFLVVQILITLLENISISIIADKRYPFLKEKCNHQVDQTVLKQIKKNTKAMIVHKIGGVAVDSTDNMIISYLLGIAIVGIYSNYTMVINALLTLIQQFFRLLRHL